MSPTVADRLIPLVWNLIGFDSTPRNLPISGARADTVPPACPLAIATTASFCSGFARSSVTTPTDQLPLSMASGVRPMTAKSTPLRFTSPYFPSSMRCTNANVHDPFVGRAPRLLVGHGQRKSQLQVSKYSPLTRQLTLSLVL